MRNAPLTASFGMFVILVYVVAAVFAPVIAPHGEAEVIGSSYAPPDENMLLGGDQLGRDMFSRIIYGRAQHRGHRPAHHRPRVPGRLPDRPHGRHPRRLGRPDLRGASSIR